MENCWGEEEVVEEVDEEEPEISSNKTAGRTGLRLTGLIDRRKEQQLGRPVWSTDVHNMHKGMSGRPPGRPQ